jgi:hypothetical protein
MAHIGSFALGARALAAPDREARRRLLTESERQPDAGAVSHNHLWMREIAIEASLDFGDWDAVDAFAERLAAYTAREPLPYWDVVIAAATVLARHGRGERNEALCAELRRLRDEAAAAEMNVVARRLDRALGAMRPAS